MRLARISLTKEGMHVRGWRAAGAATISWRTVGAVVVAAFLAIATFPAPSTVPGSLSLDGSWVLELNRLAYPERAFGSALVFTYGPFGHLLQPTEVHLRLAGVFRLAVQVVLGAIAFHVLARSRLLTGIAFALVFAASTALGLAFEYHLLAVLLLASAAASTATRAHGTIALAIVAAALVFTKLNLGIAAASMWLGALLLWTIRCGRGGLARCAASVTVFVLSVVAIGATTLASFGDLIPWLRKALELASGYSTAMSLSEPHGDVWVAIPVIAALAAASAALAWRRSRVAEVLLIAAAPLFFAFKHSFVRPDTAHVFAFFAFAVAVSAVLLPFAIDRFETTLGASLAVAVLAAAVWSIASDDLNEARQRAGVMARADLPRVAEIPRAVLGARGADHLADWVRALASASAGGEQDRDAWAARLPALADVRDHLGEATVGIVPYELWLCTALGRTCVQNPTMLTSIAYTAGLDRQSAEHFAGSRAPEVLLFGFRSVDFDWRHVAVETPATWRSILHSYRVAPAQPDLTTHIPGEQPAELMLALRRKPVFGPPAPPRSEIRATVRTDAWTPVPEMPGMRWAGIALRPTLVGRLMSVLYQVPPVFLLVAFDDGARVSYRLMPDAARNGVPLDLIPLSGDECVRAFEGVTARRAVAFAIAGPGIGRYEPEVRIAVFATEGADVRPPLLD